MIDIDNKKILVVGDVMLDRYCHGSTDRISPEAPVPVVRVDETDARPGGAGNVALNLASLGIKVSLFGLIGEDESGSELLQRLQQYGVDAQLTINPEISTITKLRVMSRHQQLIRLDQESDFSSIDHQALQARILLALDHTDLVILSDYNKGTLSEICPAIINCCREQNIPVVIDPKGNHRERYTNATLLTPNMSEFQQMVGICANEVEIETRGRQLLKDLNLQALLLTRSENGMTLIEPDRVVNIPSRVREVFDVTGAGDTVIAVFAAAVAGGESFESAAMLANRAAGIVVGKMGAATVSLSELEQPGSNALFDQKIKTEAELLILVSELRSSKSIVMTNGCFDILQPGHVANLEQCKFQGDILIVAVNDDDSVRRFKGEHRPINPLLQRMQVLAGLSSVDYVVPFAEDDPQRLIAEVLPDVLAKGGDYKVENIAGADVVLQAGGRVEIIELLKGFSSTDIIQKIRSLPG